MANDEIISLFESAETPDEYRRAIERELAAEQTLITEVSDQIGAEIEQETLQIGRTVLSSDALIQGQLGRECAPLEACLRQCRDRIRAEVSGLVMCEQACHDLYDRLCQELGEPRRPQPPQPPEPLPPITPPTEPPPTEAPDAVYVPFGAAPGRGVVPQIPPLPVPAGWQIEYSPSALNPRHDRRRGGSGWTISPVCDTRTGQRILRVIALDDMLRGGWVPNNNPPFRVGLPGSADTVDALQRQISLMASMPAHDPCREVTTPTPPHPPQPPQPPTQPQPCIPICGITPGTQPPTEPTPPEENKDCPPWKLYWSQSEQQCYLIVGDGQPKSDSDQLVAEGNDYAGLIAAWQQYCGAPQQQPPTPPTPPTPSPIQGPQLGAIDCRSVDALVGMLQSIPVGYDELARWIQDAFGVKNATVTGVSQTIDDIMKNITDPIIGGVAKLILGLVVGGLTRFIESFRDINPCPSRAFISAQIIDVLLGFAETWISGAFSKIREPLVRVKDHECPTAYPDVGSVNTAFVQSLIDSDIWAKWLRYNNHCPEPWSVVVSGMIDRLTPDQATMAFRRGLLSQNEYELQLQKAGWKRSDRATLWLELTKPIPPVQDILRFLVRDTADPAIAARFGLDDEFLNKWQGDLVVWAQQQGITEDIARHYWRAHWAIPSPTQLFEIFHRSRGLPDTHPAKRSLDDVRTALIQQDILPYWIDPILETTYQPLRIVDIYRAFEIGIIDDAEVRRQLVYRGYRDEDADAITEFYRRQKQKALAKHPLFARLARLEVSVGEVTTKLTRLGGTEETITQGLEQAYRKLKTAPPVREYIEGSITISELQAVLDSAQIPPREAELLVRWARRKKNLPLRRRCVASIRRKFVTGLIPIEQARQELIGVLGDIAEVEDTLLSFQCEASARTKPISASQLCTWFEQGLIVPDQMLTALRRLGYDQEDALRVMASCAIRLGEKQAKELERLEQRLKREAERQQREIERRQRQAEQRRQRELAKLEKLRRQREQREQRLLTYKQRVAQHAGVDISIAEQWVVETYKTLTKDAGLTPEHALMLMGMAINQYPWTDLVQLSAHVAELLAESQQFDQILGIQGNGQGGEQAG